MQSWIEKRAHPTIKFFRECPHRKTDEAEMSSSSRLQSFLPPIEYDLWNVLEQTARTENYFSRKGGGER